MSWLIVLIGIIVGEFCQFTSRYQNMTISYLQVNFIYSLWSNQRVVALSFLKRQPKFWETLTKPLLQPYTASKAKLISCILRFVCLDKFTGECGR